MLAVIVAVMMEWGKVFAQRRTTKRAIRQALSSVCVLGRRTIARSYLVRENRGEWSGEYKLYNRSSWEAEELFNPILKEAIQMCEGKILALGTDDTRIKKTGKKIPSTHWGRDPLSPPFRINLQYGLRFLHTSVLLPLYNQQGLSARALPICFEQVDPVKKPNKRASEEEKKAYRQQIKKQNLSTAALAMFKRIRGRVDQLGGEDKTLGFGLDGSFCNRTIFRADLDRTILIARARKDAKLCWPAKEGTRRKYSEEIFTPEEVRKDKQYEWKKAEIYHSQQLREVFYKEVSGLLWRRGGGTRVLRLLVVRPVAYRKTRKGKLMYRKPAYLLTTDLETDSKQLLQIYFDRWQMEVAHKELKDNFGLGQAQVRSPKSVSRQPALVVATYSAIYLAALKTYGACRTADFGPLPPYQRDKTRFSIQDLIRKLRDEVVSNTEVLPFDLKISPNSILQAATL
jgi:hypothetical protein